MDSSIPGMESVVATVSGYSGKERFDLIKLINQAGASYVGSMSRSVTHLVCWKFEGRKYDLAQKFGTVFIVNHRWVEDCVKEGKHILEHPYIRQCGEQVGPLLLEVSIADKLKPLTENHRSRLDKSNIYEDSEQQSVDMGCKDPGLDNCIRSDLLNENLFPDDGKSYSSGTHKSKAKRMKKTSKQDYQSSSRNCLRQTSMSGLVRLEDKNSFHIFSIEKKGDSSSSSSTRSMREKRKISSHEASSDTRINPIREIADETEGSSLAVPSGKGRRLVKKHFDRDQFESTVLDSDQECYPIGSHSKNSNNIVNSEHAAGIADVNILEAARASDILTGDGGSTNEALDDIEEVGDWNHLPASKDSKSLPKVALAALGKPDGSCSAENLIPNCKELGHLEPVTAITTSREVSCAICWTEYSPTRGVLPCGHRFCYQCIQNWADHAMQASRGQTASCPLCKASFVSITKVEDAASADQKIYSQTIPCNSAVTHIFISSDEERYRIGPEFPSAHVCCECHCREPEDLLVSCHICQVRCIHSYCLDPPILPWTCIHCQDLRMRYHQTL